MNKDMIKMALALQDEYRTQMKVKFADKKRYREATVCRHCLAVQPHETSNTHHDFCVVLVAQRIVKKLRDQQIQERSGDA